MTFYYRIGFASLINVSRRCIAVTAVVFLFGMGRHVFGYSEQPPTHTEKISKSHLSKACSEKKELPSFEVLTEVHAALEAAGVSGGDYRARTSRELYFDAFRIRNFFFHFSLRENILFSSSPNQLDHEFTYAGIRYRTSHGNIILFWDHTCHNPSRKLPENEKNGIHWNELGVRYETPGMKIGHRNDGITFITGHEWLNRFNWSVSLSKIWMRTENEYEWMGKYQIRYDIFRYEKHIFFIQGELHSTYDERGLTSTYSVETGDRFCWRHNECLIPFIAHKKYYDWYGTARGEDFFLAGLRLEMNLGRNSHISADKESTTWSWNPDIHVVGGYANVMGDSTFGHSSDVSMILDIAQWNPYTKLSMTTYAGILTLPDDLNPYLVKYEIGPSMSIDLYNHLLKLSYSYACLYGVEQSHSLKNYHFLGMEVRNRDPSPWSWDIKLGGYPASTNFDNWGNVEGSIRYDVPMERVSPYIHLSAHLFVGDDLESGYTLEPGIRIQDQKGSFSIYLRRQDNHDIFRYGKGRQTLLGVRFEF